VRCSIHDSGSNFLNNVVLLIAGLSVYDNFLSGTIPDELTNLQNLQLVYIDENDLRGPVPDELCLLDLQEFWADCEETQCLCCTTCCNDDFGCV
jgi:hypothetical protein